MATVFISNGSGSTIYWRTLDPSNPSPNAGRIDPGGSESVSMGTAVAIGLTDFSGDAYIAAPGTNIGYDAELVACKSGDTPPDLTPSGAASGLALVFNVAGNSAGWIELTNDLGPLSGPLGTISGVPLPLDSDVMWIGITGLANNDVYTPAPGFVTGGYQAALLMLPGNSSTTEAHAALARASGSSS